MDKNKVNLSNKNLNRVKLDIISYLNSIKKRINKASYEKFTNKIITGQRKTISKIYDDLLMLTQEQPKKKNITFKRLAEDVSISSIFPIANHIQHRKPKAIPKQLKVVVFIDFMSPIPKRKKYQHPQKPLECF
jgi:hypothetical protein